MKRFKVGSFALGLLALVVIGGGITYGANKSAIPKSDRNNAQMSTQRIETNPNYVEHRTALDEHNVQPSNISIKKLHAKSAIVMDADNGNILYQKNAHQPRKVASLAKLMTLYLTQRKANKIDGWNDVVPIPKNLSRMSYNTKQGLGGFKFQKNHTYTVKELYEAALVKSSNNAAIALGEWVANSNKNFVNLMNEQAKAWDLKAKFVSPSGLENEDLDKYGLNVSGGHKTGNEVSAVDLAIIAQHLLNEDSHVTKIAKKQSINIDGQQLENATGQILPGGNLYDSDLHIDGLKSGFTPMAGLCYVGTCKPLGKHRIITVVLKDPQELQDTKKLMFETYHQLGNHA